MDYANYVLERPLFYALFKAVEGEPYDLGNFDRDECYAAWVLERALCSDNFELRNLAAHLQTYRQSAIEVIALKSPERMDRTWKHPTVAIDVLVPRVGPPAPVPPSGPGAPYAERRSGIARFTVLEILALSTLQRLYRKEFSNAVDVEQFATDDAYGRQVLRESLASSNLELTAVANTFIDHEGRFRRHRRGTDSENLAGSSRR